MANPNTDRVLMDCLKTILPGYPTPNTRIAQLNCPIVIENEYAVSTGKFPAVHIEVGLQRHTKCGPGYEAVMHFVVTYFDRWDTQKTTIDALRLQIDNDLQQMMTNVQNNSSLTIGGVVRAVSVPTIDLSDYKGEIDDKTVPGLSLVKRFMTLTTNVLPYDLG